MRGLLERTMWRLAASLVSMSRLRILNEINHIRHKLLFKAKRVNLEIFVHLLLLLLLFNLLPFVKHFVTCLSLQIKIIIIILLY